MQWTYVRDGRRRACTLRRVEPGFPLLEISYECADSPIVVPFDDDDLRVCAQVALERDWVAAGWSLETFAAD